MVPVSLKSNLVPTSRRAWSIAFVSSAALNSETTSNENSAIQDGVDADDHGHDGKGHAGERRDREQRTDAGGAFVERLGRRLVVRVGSVVEVVDALRARPLHQLLEHWFAAWRKRLAVEVIDRLLEVVSGLAELRNEHVQRFHRAGGRVLAPQVGDDPVKAHVQDRTLPHSLGKVSGFPSPLAGEGVPARSARTDGGEPPAIHLGRWVWTPKQRPRRRSRRRIPTHGSSSRASSRATTTSSSA